ncbi:hypothetical protein AB0M54_32185 [Actinoplanes sp. NPDC051470]|uniref:AAA family ATPase n=1 Tax=unclassified Actinoplanes TaxID=2626549 RepID=UPI00341B1E67
MEALLINGTVGSGKTSTADALGDLLAGDEVPHAVIDMDWLRRAWPSPPGDPFRSDLALRNLAAVAANFREAGARRLVVAGVIEERDERDDYQAALGLPLRVCRLRVDLATVRDRLIRRHTGDDAGLRWHLDRSGELDAILERAGTEDFVVDAGDRPVAGVAAAIRKAAGW